MPTPLLVPTCIGCGARHRAGSCPDGCDDVAIDLVETADLDAAEARGRALERRIEALLTVAGALAASSEPWPTVQEVARRALAVPAPAPLEEVTIVAAWGCLTCGRVDAPQPCLGICIREPVAMSDAALWRALAPRLEAWGARERALTSLARLVAHTVPKPGQVDATRAALRRRAQVASAEGAHPT